MLTFTIPCDLLSLDALGATTFAFAGILALGSIRRHRSHVDNALRITAAALCAWGTVVLWARPIGCRPLVGNIPVFVDRRASVLMEVDGFRVHTDGWPSTSMIVGWQCKAGAFAAPSAAADAADKVIAQQCLRSQPIFGWSSASGVFDFRTPGCDSSLVGESPCEIAIAPMSQKELRLIRLPA